MALNPPFMMEDTDEDFFDKLVNDDDDYDYKLHTLPLKESKIADDNDSDDAKAFANLSISNVGTGIEDLGKLGIEEEDIKDTSSISKDIKDESANTTTPVEPSHLAYSNSFASDSLNEEADIGTIQLQEPLDSTKSENENHGSGGTAGIKEVQWSAFGSDSVDFFNEFGDGSVDQEVNFGSSEFNSVVNNSFQLQNVNDYSQEFQTFKDQGAYATVGKQETFNDYSQQFTGDQVYATTGEQGTDGQHPESSQNWENLYPGWRYDSSSGQWYQIEESYNETKYAQGADSANSASDWIGSHEKSEVSYLQQSAQSVVGAVAETGTTEKITNWNSVYPSNMVFDANYPGWYYDMNVQEWRSLDDYNSQSSVVAQDQNGFGSNNTYHEIHQKTYEQSQGYNWNGSFNNADSTMWQPNHNVANKQQVAANHYVNQQQSYDYDYGGTTASSFNKATQVNNNGFVPFDQSLSQQNEMMNVQKGHEISYGSRAGRSSARRPPHALVTFGFGGKLIVMKNSTNVMNASFGGQDSNCGSISVHNLAEEGGNEYIETLCQQSFPGPLSGGKELNKWIDERIRDTESADINLKQAEVVRLLFSLLKIASQHYGKFRSPFGSDTAFKDSDGPELAVAKLFASVKNNSGDHASFAQCLQQLPSEAQTRESAGEVQSLLVSGKKKEALVCAQEGQLWGPALVLAAQLGDQFYVDTVKKMALVQLVPGSPLRTLCLLIAGQPADVFATPDNTPQGESSMVDEWEDNLAVITANRTKDDELVLTHLGDCLWKERSNIIGAHICYLVAEANFEAYSDSARLCLIGADHLKHPRTYASPQAIQRTEVYEYSKLLGNSQFTLLPFQPYKLIYAHMLAEVGRLSDSLKYCHAVTKSLKTGRIPEVETWRQLVASLEDRIKTHQQGGFSTNLAPGKIVGKLFNFFDSTAQRVVGGMPPPVPSASAEQPARVLTSQSTMVMSSFMEPVGDPKMMHNRSVSEPDFGRSARQDEPNSQTKSSGNNNNNNNNNNNSKRFSRFSFGSGLFQKTVGMVLKPRQEKQAKLGDTNKFYYDEKLKRWVEEGAEQPVEEAVLAPPPTIQNGPSDNYSLNSVLRTESSPSPNPTPPASTLGIPPNQFSARGRTGVRARYVDTFNKGGGNPTPTNLFQPPSIKPPSTNPNPNFFVPPAPQQPLDNNLLQENTPSNNNQTPSFSSRAPSPLSTGMPKHASMNDMSKGGTSTLSSSSFVSHPMSRKTLSWNGNGDQDFSSSGNNEFKPFGGAFMPNQTDSSSDDLQEVEL